jgi:hypothetical protein
MIDESWKSMMLRAEKELTAALTRKPHFIQLTDAEVQSMEPSDLAVPHLFRAPSGYYFCDPIEYRNWRKLRESQNQSDAEQK